MPGGYCLTEGRKVWRRRAVLAGGAVGVAAWVIWLPRLMTSWPSRLTFRDLPGLAPFRVLQSTGGLSAGSAALAGLEPTAPADPEHDARVAAVRADPCGALFGPITDARLPVAIFSDFNCPNCRALGEILQDVATSYPDQLRIIRHELPLLGTASTLASQAVLAADRQGGYEAMHSRLMRTRMITDMNLLASIAEAAGLDAQRLLADMQTPEIASALERSKAIATVFGLRGVPATAIGRTVFLGVIPAADVRQIVEAELAALPLACGRA